MMITPDMCLSTMQEAVNDADNKEVKKLEQNYLVRATSVPDKQHPWEYHHKVQFIAQLICGIVLMAAAGVAFGRYLASRPVRGEALAERRSHGYVPMAVIEEGSDDETLLLPEDREDRETIP
jgi:hypothetical protein